MRTTHTFEIQGSKYQVNMWHPDKAMANLTWLVKTAGEPLVQIFMTVESLDELMDKNIDFSTFVPAVKGIFQKLDENQVVSKVHAFTEEILCDGKALEYESHFLGRPGLLMKVLIQVVKGQYADFFDEIPDGILTGKT